MRAYEILEGLSQVAKREVDNPHPEANDPDVGWIYGDAKITARSVITDILGDKAKFDDDLQPGDFAVSGPWSGMGSMFSNMDEPPGGGGAIAINDPYGQTPKDIAIAAHEAYHALLQSRSKNFVNEHVVNRLAFRWLQDHLSGMFLHAALEAITTSKRAYKGRKYDSSRKYNK